MLYKFYLYKYEKEKLPETGEIELKTSDMMFVGSAELETLDECGDVFNSKLRQFLIDNGIKQFLPIKRPSLEEGETECSICYYHDNDWYNYIYHSLPEDSGLIMAPMITSIYDSKYNAYGLNGWWDPRAHTGIDLEIENK